MCTLLKLSVDAMVWDANLRGSSLVYAFRFFERVKFVTLHGLIATPTGKEIPTELFMEQISITVFLVNKC